VRKNHFYSALDTSFWVTDAVRRTGSSFIAPGV
jgi:hypothetical protein